MSRLSGIPNRICRCLSDRRWTAAAQNIFRLQKWLFCAALWPVCEEPCEDTKISNKLLSILYFFGLFESIVDSLTSNKKAKDKAML